MKRLLPMKIHGAFVLAAISIPPVTALANRQQPTASQPGRPQAASNAAATAATA